MQSQAVYNDFNALANLRSDARQNADGTLEDVAKQFESLFVQMMLKSMRDATTQGGLFDSDQMESYQQMHDQQLSLDLASRGGIGLADVLVQQLRSDRAAAEAGAADGVVDLRMPGLSAANAAAFNVQPYLEFRVPSLQSAPTVAEAAPLSNAQPWTPSTPQEFAEHLRPLAVDAANELGVSAEVLLAQAALETGWGKHVSSSVNGSSNNLFNIKAGSDWEGPTVTVQTLEYREGVAVRETAQFRAYASPAESFADYVSLIKESPRYSAAKDLAAEPEQYLKELQQAGYATDPAYAEKILAILRRGDLNGTTAALKNPADLPLKS
ncbi:flagellar assembly peptidoglycan hydrolase FlgJ [Congregibacter brevis]|uniref:Peptidoglycan hydrolase FlgJ n=1 Tax=Congregibacter brevis TaxID=3081201 RepID=A0ABZ0ID88_9GAMM|nr:flagellar assembly peptidoglycan hydrolase FlgJ [Congregibacter sp. IMCC45268]